ncbi:MAG: signal peptidase II [Deltaproteobacteria bacterium]|nr:signal peptidase II [Deltaproteobacteria bacterium]
MKYLYVSVSAAVSFVLDQLTKSMILDRFREGEMLAVIPGFFDLTLRFNRGAAFSLFDGKPSTFFFILAALAIGALLYFVAGLNARERGQLVALGAILGGAVGNLIDRIRMGAVTDFLVFHFRGLEWPAFNVADTVIVVGVVIFLWKNLQEAKTAPREEA